MKLSVIQRKKLTSAPRAWLFRFTSFDDVRISLTAKKLTLVDRGKLFCKFFGFVCGALQSRLTPTRSNFLGTRATNYYEQGCWR